MNGEAVLRCGWEAFVHAHHIEENDSLVFRHIENSRFEVLILDSDDCEKIFSCAGIKNSSIQEEKSADPDDISVSSRDDTAQSSGSQRFTTRPRGRFSDRRNNRNLAAMSFSSEESENCVFEYEPLMKCCTEDSLPESESPAPVDLQTSPGSDYVLSRKSYLSEEQKEKVVAHVQKIQPETTVFVSIIKKSSVQSPGYLSIPSDYAAVHFPRETATVTLQRPGKNKKWYPRFYKRKDKSVNMLRGHWLDFVHDNHVQEEDICLFVRTKGGKRFTFTVHLLRAAATHCRGGTGVHKIGPSHNKITTKMSSQIHIKEEPASGENVSSESNRHGVSHESQESEESDGPPEHPYVLPYRGRRLSELQKKIIKEKVQAIQSEAPIYVATMGKTSTLGGSNGCILELGSRYAAAHLPARNQPMLLNCKGKTWQTNMLVSRNRARWFLSTGWRRFVHDNRLLVGDVCLFELKKQRKLTMEVHIIFRDSLQ
ncbi:hypothetical protein ABZP36_020142 [Zizania latifolia]